VNTQNESETNHQASISGTTAPLLKSLKHFLFVACNGMECTA
jgi:hypothetical protein